jgi:hypothetical protein
MKNFLSAIFEHKQPLSKKLLFSSFMTGYCVATIIFTFFRPLVHRFLDSILQGL